MTPTAERNRYGALRVEPQWTIDLMEEAEKAGTYTRGIESDKRQRGSSINVDLYGHDEAQGLAVIQVRECQFDPRRYNKVHKDYYLLGHTEQGAVFAHPIESPARSRRAMTSPEACIRFVLSRIWDCSDDDLADIVRQGDVALVPARLPENAVRLDTTETIIRDTHRVRAAKLYRAGGTIYACRRVSIVHLRHQHATVQVHRGVYRVAEGREASTWGFSAPTAD